MSTCRVNPRSAHRARTHVCQPGPGVRGTIFYLSIPGHSAGAQSAVWHASDGATAPALWRGECAPPWQCRRQPQSRSKVRTHEQRLRTLCRTISPDCLAGILAQQAVAESPSNQAFLRRSVSTSGPALRPNRTGGRSAAVAVPRLQRSPVAISRLVAPSIVVK